MGGEEELIHDDRSPFPQKSPVHDTLAPHRVFAAFGDRNPRVSTRWRTRMETIAPGKFNVFCDIGHIARKCPLQAAVLEPKLPSFVRSHNIDLIFADVQSPSSRLPKMHGMVVHNQNFSDPLSPMSSFGL